MATANPLGPLGRPIRFHEEDYPYWRDHIPAEDRAKLLQEDLLAGESVVAMMLAIIVVAFLMAVATVWIVCH